MKLLKFWWLVGIIAWLLGGCAPACADDPACTRVLFIGNSYTYVNDLPKTFTKLAQAGGQRVETGMAAQGGWSLADHVQSADTLNQLQAAKWKYVVLQEQSQTPASEQARATWMYPAARILVGKIRDAGATPLLFVTWAHQDGWPEANLPTYDSMQLQIDGGYMALSQELRVPMAPVGFAWIAAWQQNPQLSLWQDDGSHPNDKGTYLAACVFYATIFQKSPAGLAYRATLSKEEAQWLQKIAGDTVLNNKRLWNLP